MVNAWKSGFCKACEICVARYCLAHQEFDEGSGTVDLLREALDGLIEKVDASAYQARAKNIRSPEEAVYKLLVESYRRPQ
jgi:hypothetical protein